MAGRLRETLGSFSMGELRQRILDYEANARIERTAEEIYHELGNVLQSDYGFVMPIFEEHIREGIDLFRGRIISRPGEMARVSDAWEAPAAVTRAGRLNAQSEPLLYTAGAQSTAFYESRIKPGDLFAMSKFRTRSRFPVTRIGDPDKIVGLTVIEQEKLSVMLQFIEDVFTQKAGPEESHIYRAPERLAKIYFDYPPELARGWIYRSIADPSGFGRNLCLRPADGHELLELIQVDVCRCLSVDRSNRPVRFDPLEVRMEDPATGDLIVVWQAS